jgi:hypothetical protein
MIEVGARAFRVAHAVAPDRASQPDGPPRLPDRGRRGDGHASLGPSEAQQIVHRAHGSHGEFHEAVTWVRGRESERSAVVGSGAGLLAGHAQQREQAKMLSKKLVHFARDTVNELLTMTERAADLVVDVLASRSRGGGSPRPWPSRSACAVERAPLTFDELAHIGGVRWWS